MKPSWQSQACKPYALRDRRELPPLPLGGTGTAGRLRTIWLMRRHYARRVLFGLRAGQTPGDFVRTLFPLAVADAPVPPCVTIELTNVCNLRCRYCASRVNDRAAGVMAERTFASLLADIRESHIHRVNVVGYGEPTLHPDFARFICQLGAATPLLVMASNWQQVDEEIIRSILDAPVRLLNISLDGADRERYERSRVGGSFDHLLENLELLRRLQPRRSATWVNIRMHVRPSDRGRERQMAAFWRPYADEVTCQYVADWTGIDDDVYGLKCAEGVWPRCALPFKQLPVQWNGNVPLCIHSDAQSGEPDGLLLGNINTQTLVELWNCPTMRQYRVAHRAGAGGDMPLCSGCPGG